MTNIKDSGTIDKEEIEKFAAMADEWWDESGKFKPLHIFNPVRIKYIKEIVCKHFGIEKTSSPFEGLELLDVGCGGGLISEPMCRLGANVTAIDASEKNIKIASVHSEKMNLDINYKFASVEELAQKKKKYDVILSLEVLEHVNNVEEFIEKCTSLLAPSGIIFFATLNKTIKSYMAAIVGAEYILRWLPKGTHDWKKFMRPSQISNILSHNQVTVENVQGISYNPFANSWHLSNDTSINYIICGTNKNN